MAGFSYFKCIMASKSIQVISISLFVVLCVVKSLWGHLELHGPNEGERRVQEQEARDKRDMESCERHINGTGDEKDFERYYESIN